MHQRDGARRKAEATRTVGRLGPHSETRDYPALIAELLIVAAVPWAAIRIKCCVGDLADTVSLRLNHKQIGILMHMLQEFR